MHSYSSHMGTPFNPRASSMISGRFAVAAILAMCIEKDLYLRAKNKRAGIEIGRIEYATTRPKV